MSQTGNSASAGKEDLRPGKGSKLGYVVAGAILSCSFGTQPTRLKRPLSHGVYIKGKAQMNVGDCEPGVNISGFGRCWCKANPAVKASKLVDIYGVPKAPCVPVITGAWIGGKKDVLIEGQPALLQSCSNACMYGGMIRIDDDGQNLD
ncbi:PAAR-like protein [Paenibacillus sp. FSL K6-1230]|uniref:PAAR-like protein n=1 Tax=Paenibacillus sp. FSL K6-1230 TaxID=2921603 RepID=UPI00105CB4F9